MRVITGKYRGRVLKSPSDLKTRPTSDRLKETLFNILNTRLNEKTNFLDLCAGTGAIGIEAISRGVNKVLFVEIARRNCSLIEENLKKLKIPEFQTEVFCAKVEKFVLNSSSKFDVVYFDPPYQNDYEIVLSRLGEQVNGLLSPQGIVIAEHSKKKNLPDSFGELHRTRFLKQGDSALSFYEIN